MKLKPFLTTLALAGGLATTASATTYTCKMQDQSNSGWISPTIVVAHDEQSGEVVVNDILIKNINGRPLAGEVAIDNAKRTTFKWVIKGYTNTHGANRQYATELTYRITIQKSSRQATITMKPAGYGNMFRGKGACSVK